MTGIIEITAPIEQEGTKAVVRNWLKRIGDHVREGDALVELETDKVTQEIAAPCDGILSEIAMSDGDNAMPGAILGRMRAESANGVAAQAAEAPSQIQPASPATASAAAYYSPAVRKAAEEYGIDPASLKGSGRDGRVTRADMDHALETAKPHPSAPVSQRVETGQTPPAVAADGKSRIVPHSAMRLSIARHMAQSLATAPQVTAIFEADFTAIMRHRESNKARLKAEGVNLSYTAYFVAASVAAMKLVPEVNSQWHDDSLEIFEDINIGISIALGDKGLVAPIIRQAQNLQLEAIAARLQDLTDRARSNALKADDMKGGTFTISNHGASGSLVASPIIINQPQSAILGIGKLEKRVIVREVDGADTIQIRPMAYVSLTIDHRSLDGHQTNAWLSEFVRVLQDWPQ
ncbi:dihydrolipoamide acetyltransferase family protein [Rhizobium tropici]|uniref:Dihydrolipoamide acetyltransferase component of pyruvate dehydrogenase complex n=1 Tax=Rhizobium tropici TaxID=398 RepID=A0ABR6QVB2_RHITR|nr:2-oxo acid dehydrogenase subunit E2 [Rhizobium tropici]MBB4240762.1 2-oxoglutarate dehydrogenase E2 component (dihydrolipoamide succinyltransferase) [Rhizobium tropici]MBB6490875.1 2-oxoglutarate dehydrogenase E2 component (dihydrolipoamide succinyltransferase) [Rhizobium tropici]